LSVVLQAGAAPVASSPSSQIVQTPTSSAPAPATQIRYKYKYPEAYPTPPGEEDEVWNKLFTAADSRLYNKHGKSAIESKKYRASGATYQLALQMLQEKKDKAASATLAGGGKSSLFP
jgi:COMPASS component SPP1